VIREACKSTDAKEAWMLALVGTGRDVDVELRELPEPVPAPHEAVIEVRAVSLNRGELRALRTGEPGTPIGWDLAGEVRAPAADGTGPAAGARVVGLVPRGAWARRVAVRTDMLALLPDGVSYETAATLPVAGVTAWRVLQLPETIFERRVLVTGASGGVGRFLIQLASHLGAHVTAVVTSDAHADRLRALGADDVVVGMPQADDPFHVIAESVGGATLGRALELVDERGWVVSFGISSGEPTTFDAGRFFRKGGARLHGLYLFEEVRCHRSGSVDLAHLVEEAERGALVADIGMRTSWRDAASAIEALAQRRVDGKAVLVVD
jgi:NADPH:quinone reductase-like Zn-dependent oxidoreductase